MKMVQYFDAREVNALKTVSEFKAKTSQLSSLILLISDESFRNWDSVFQDDMLALVKDLTGEINGLQSTLIEEVYLQGLNAKKR
jgi:hypothetical protein